MVRLLVSTTHKAFSVHHTFIRGSNKDSCRKGSEYTGALSGGAGIAPLCSPSRVGRDTFARLTHLVSVLG